jgi:WD40 repeat protein
LDQNSVLDRLALVERAIVGNSYEKKVIMFRNVADDGMIEKKRTELLAQSKEETEQEAALKSQAQPKDDYATNSLPALQLLWNYKCELTRGRSISCVSLNKQNEDIIAVAYGESRFIHGASPGLILCWSAKNPEWPDRIYNSESPCTSIDFSKLNPGLLAAGYFDGRVMIYNTKLNQSKVLVECESNGKHRDPVWELQWVEKEKVVGDDQSRCETLVSVSTDGRVTQWMIRKGLEFTDLMILKRLTKQKKQGNNSTVNTNSFISRQTGGLCFDFNSKDPNMYL